MVKDLLSRAEKYADHFSGSCDICCSVLEAKSKCFVSEKNKIGHFCDFCINCPSLSGGRIEYDINPHLYGMYEAERWGGKYVYYCPGGLIYIASPLTEDNNLLGALIVGPMVMGNKEDIIDEWKSRVNYKDFIDLIDKIPQISAAKVNHIAELLAATTAFVCGSFWKDISAKEQSVELQSEISYYLQEIKENEMLDGRYEYPIEIERKLQAMIVGGDEVGARELLNQLLGHIFFASSGDLELIKARVVELIVLLSRASIDGGADARRIFGLNANYLKEINTFKSIDELCAWLANIMVRFCSYVFDFVHVKHNDIIYKAVNYIKSNYANKISLDSIANHVYLSRSYLSKIFKDEMNCNITNYINKIRVEKSKLLLLDNTVNLVDIANLVGFEDQSYFTKVFKKETGLSPGKFREKRGVI